MTGFYSGLYQGKLYNESIADSQLGRQAKMQRMAFDAQDQPYRIQNYQDQNQLSQLEAQKRQFDLGEAQRKQEDEIKTAKILQNAFAATTPERVGQTQQDQDDIIGNISINAGKQVLGVDPKAGMELIKAGQTSKQQAAYTAVRNMEFKKAQIQRAAEVASTVTDQQTLDESLEELSKNGVTVPDRFRTWNPATKEWFANRAVASTTYLKKLEIDQRSKQLEIQEAENQSKQEDRLAKQKATQIKEERLRSQVRARASSTKISKNDLETTVAGLNEIPEFDDLDAGAKLNAAKHVLYLANQFISDGTSSNYVSALAKAKQEVKSRIDPDSGEYKGFSADTENASGQVAKPTSQAEFDALPSGATFINPKDGKTYRKK